MNDPATAPTKPGVFRKLRWPLLAVVVLLAAWFVYKKMTSTPPAPRSDVRPVRVAVAALKDIPVFFNGLGTVTPVNTVLVKSRVDGELISLHFEEGQDVKAGDLLAVIDPRPYEVMREQALGSLTKNEALLKDARLDLERYKRLIKEGSIPPQKLQAQEALVGQYAGAVITDKANVDNAELMLGYCRVTAPITGRLGLKKVDVGNMIRASDSNGLVVITQVKPMNVIFTLVDKRLSAVLAAMGGPDPLVAECWDQDDKERLATGRLLTIDNQIDSSTGMFRLKAEFANDKEILFPNQFVNVRLLVETLRGVVTIPIAAVQRDNEGVFVYRVKGETVQAVKIKIGYSDAADVVILEGVNERDVVVIDGTDRLRDGINIRFDLEREQDAPLEGEQKL